MFTSDSVLFDSPVTTPLRQSGGSKLHSPIRVAYILELYRERVPLLLVVGLVFVSAPVLLVSVFSVKHAGSSFYCCSLVSVSLRNRVVV